MVHSFAIHVAQCQELFDKREALKPPKERRKCPSDPMANYAPSSSSGKNMSQRELDHMNALSQQQWSNEALMPCGNCGRRFLAEKLPIHQRSCTADHPSRRVNEPVARGQTASSYGTTQAGPAGSGNGGYSGPDEYEYASSVTVAGFNQCRSCGRRFNDLAYEKYVVYMLNDLLVLRYLLFIVNTGIFAFVRSCRSLGKCLILPSTVQWAQNWSSSRVRRGARRCLLQ
jgi:hypothetical protein